MKTINNLPVITFFFFCMMLSAITASFAGDLLEPTRTLQEPGKSWGDLTIFSEPPQLDVYLDGAKIGNTPLWLRQIETGVHTVRIGDAETSVLVEKDEGVRIGLFKGSFVKSAAPEKQKPKLAPPRQETGLVPTPTQAEEQKRHEDLTSWEKFVNGTLKSF